MRAIFALLCALTCSLATPCVAAEPELESLTKQAEQAFAKQDFPAAIAAYQQAIDEAPLRAEIHFNLGLAAIAQRRWPLAILSFERVLYLSPGDDEADLYLSLVREHLQRELLAQSTQRRITQGESAELTWWRFFQSFGKHAPVLALIATWWLFFAALIWRRGQKAQALRDGLAVFAAIMLLGALTAAILWGGQIQTQGLRPAVLMAQEPMLFDGPSTQAQALKPDDLYPGALVIIIEDRDPWLLIELANGERGWLRRQQLEEIKVDSNLDG